MHTPIAFELQGNTGFIALNRPQRRNALSLSMIQALDSHIRAWEADTAVERIIVTSVPEQVFCAGGDIRAVYELGQKDPEKAQQFFHHEYQLNYLISTLTTPYVVIMDGLTMGGGVGIAYYGRLRIATENTRWAMPETAIGFFPDIGASYFLSRLPKNMGRFLALTGYELNASECVWLNLADFSTTEMEQPLQQHTKAIEAWFAGNSVEAIFQSLSSDSHPFAKQILHTLQQRSPLSLKATFALLEHGKNLPLKACLAMEYHLAGEFLKQPDFYEGIRTMLIDKDKNPQWQVRDITAIADTTITQLFNRP